MKNYWIYPSAFFVVSWRQIRPSWTNEFLMNMKWTYFAYLVIWTEELKVSKECNFYNFEKVKNPCTLLHLPNTKFYWVLTGINYPFFVLSLLVGKRINTLVYKSFSFLTCKTIFWWIVINGKVAQSVLTPKLFTANLAMHFKVF